MLARQSSRQFAVKAGVVGLVAGILGVVIAGVMLLWPPQVEKGPLSYPFTHTGFVIAQGIFFVHHFGLIVPLWTLAVSGAVGTGRFFRGGAWMAVVGMALLTLAELNTMRF